MLCVLYWIISNCVGQKWNIQFDVSVGFQRKKNNKKQSFISHYVPLSNEAAPNSIETMNVTKCENLQTAIKTKLIKPQRRAFFGAGHASHSTIARTGC